MRLDRLVASVLGLSRRCARLVIGAGRVRVGGRTCKILTRTLHVGARYVIQPEPNSAPAVAAPAAFGAGGTPRRPPCAGAPRLLHIDRWLVAIDKPAGLGAWLRRQRLPDALWLVHRLDAGTSGVLLLARHRGVAAALNEAFAARATHKAYVALCHGVPAAMLELTGAIARVRGTQHGVRAAGKPARTVVALQRHANGYAQVLAEPHSGRTHQIRVHLAHAGCPIVGDRLYGGPGYLPGRMAGHAVAVPRPLLHARSLQLDHPKTGVVLQLQAPLPADLVAAASHLELGP